MIGSFIFHRAVQDSICEFSTSCVQAVLSRACLGVPSCANRVSQMSVMYLDIGWLIMQHLSQSHGRYDFHYFYFPLPSFLFIYKKEKVRVPQGVIDRPKKGFANINYLSLLSLLAKAKISTRCRIHQDKNSKLYWFLNS